jgi:ATP-dependent RNA helicase DDX52/ROK1
MDILKVLSRGTKKAPRAAQNAQQSHNGRAPVKLPSAGTKTNPQLFNDDVRGQKRKRTAKDEEPQGISALPAHLPEIDFFAPKAETTPKAHDAGDRTDRQPSPPPTATAVQRLSEDECRQLLKSHRLKVTLMTRPEDTSSRVKKRKKDEKKMSKDKKKQKKGSKAEPEEEVKKKDTKRQLYPQPLVSFGELRSAYGIPRKLAENLVAQGYRQPTEVQLGSLPLLLRPERAVQAGGDDDDVVENGLDFLAIAPTGSGKTISFLIPAIDGIMRRREQEGRKGSDTHELEAVVLAPTRELAHQIVSEGSKLAQGTGVKIVAMRKGMTLASDTSETAEDSVEGSDAAESDDESQSDEEKDDVRRPRGAITKTDILVTTPQLLLNSFSSESVGPESALSKVQDLILDEADVLLDPLFREQTMRVWTACTSHDLRTSCWSATMGSNIESLVTEKLKARAEVLQIDPRPLVRLVVGLKDTAVPNISHRLIYTASEQGKLLALRQLLHPTSGDDAAGPPLRPPFLVFTQTIDRAAALQEELKYDIPLEAGGPARIAALHGGLADGARAAIMRRFRAGEIWVLITTDVLARGVDFAGVNGVVNYDVPGSSAAYVHRAGRTGRAGREGGVAVTLYTKEDIPFVKTVANVIAASERQAGKPASDASVQKWLLDALPNVAKADRKKLRERGVEARRSDGGRAAMITTTSGYERRREQNKRGAIESSKRRKTLQKDGGSRGDTDQAEWGGFDD